MLAMEMTHIHYFEADFVFLQKKNYYMHAVSVLPNSISCQAVLCN